MKFISKKITLIFTVMASIISPIKVHSQGTDLETRLPIRLYASPQLDTIGGEALAVYWNENLTSESADAKKARFFYTEPLFLPNWTALEASVAEECKEGDPPSKDAYINLKIKFWSSEIRNEIAKKISEKEKANGGKDVPSDNIYVYPHYQIKITSRDAKGNFKNLANFPDNNPSDDSNKANIQTLLFSESTKPIVETCGFFKQLVKNHSLLNAYMYSKNDTATKDSISLKYQQIVRTIMDDSIDTNEAQSGSKTISTSATGEAKHFGISLAGPLSVADTGTTSTNTTSSTDSRQRFISQNYLQNLSRKSATSFKSVSFLETAAFSEKDVEAKFMRFIERNSKEQVLAIKPNADKQLQIIGDGINRTLSTPQANELLSSKPEQTSDVQNEHDVSVESAASFEGASASAKGSEKRKAGTKFENKDLVTWSYEGKDWVPTSIKVRVFSIQDLSTSADIDKTLITISRGSGTVVMTLKSPTTIPERWDNWSERTGALEEKVEKEISALKNELFKVNKYLDASKIVIAGFVGYQAAQDAANAAIATLKAQAVACTSQSMGRTNYSFNMETAVCTKTVTGK